MAGGSQTCAPSGAGLVAYPGFMGVPSSPGAKHKSWQSQPQESSILQAAYHALTCRGHLQVPFSPGLSSQFNLLVCLAYNRGASRHSAAHKEESQKERRKGCSFCLSSSWSAKGCYVSLLLQGASIAQHSAKYTQETKTSSTLSCSSPQHAERCLYASLPPPSPTSETL